MSIYYYQRRTLKIIQKYQNNIDCNMINHGLSFHKMSLEFAFEHFCAFKSILTNSFLNVLKICYLNQNVSLRQCKHYLRILFALKYTHNERRQS